MRSKKGHTVKGIESESVLSTIADPTQKKEGHKKGTVIDLEERNKVRDKELARLMI